MAWPGFDPGLPHESISLCWVTHAGGLGSNPGQAELWRLVTLKPLKLQQCTLHFWKPLIFFYLDKRGQEPSCMFIYDMLSGIPIGLLHKIANKCKHSQAILYENLLVRKCKKVWFYQYLLSLRFVNFSMAYFRHCIEDQNTLIGMYGVVQFLNFYQNFILQFCMSC